jgi:hypothetical protein
MLLKFILKLNKYAIFILKLDKYAKFILKLNKYNSQLHVSLTKCYILIFLLYFN